MDNLQLIQSKIFEIHVQKVMLDFDLAKYTELYKTRQHSSHEQSDATWNVLKEMILCLKSHPMNF